VCVHWVADYSEPGTVDGHPILWSDYEPRGYEQLQVDNHPDMSGYLRLIRHRRSPPDSLLRRRGSPCLDRVSEWVCSPWLVRLGLNRVRGRERSHSTSTGYVSTVKARRVVEPLQRP